MNSSKWIAYSLELQQKMAYLILRIRENVANWHEKLNSDSFCAVKTWYDFIKKDFVTLWMYSSVCVCYNIVFGYTGMVELVPSSETLRKIQVEYGVTGSFKDKPLAEWLRKYNPAEDEYEKVSGWL